MSRLETTAARVLTPLIRGEPGTVLEDDQGALAAWVQKTALVSMLTTSGDGRERLPAGEYRGLHARRDHFEPLPASQFWIGRYEGSRVASAWLTPMVVRIDGVAEPEIPHAYVMTILLGAVLLQGVRFTQDALYFEMGPAEAFAEFWPKRGPASWPSGSVVDDDRFLKVSKGLNLASRTPGLALQPWKPAVDLPASAAAGSLVRLPTPCGKHFVYYPAAFVREAARRIFYAFVTGCECGRAYLVETESDGAHFKREGDGEEEIESVLETYEALDGCEVMIQGNEGPFVCKRLPR